MCKARRGFPSQSIKTCYYKSHITLTTNLQIVSDGEFYWSSVQQGYVLGGFSYGYVCTQFLGGILAERYGGKWVIGLGTFLSTAAGQVQMSDTHTLVQTQLR